MGKLVSVDPRCLVQATSDDGGYICGKCVACGASGWMNSDQVKGRLGVPHGSKLTAIVHKENCPLGAALNTDGSIKPAYR